MVPRSRLALAVPFIGKDVPSKSSEFAHPDITIGLTVMAYRYSGLRTGDFNDLVDSVRAAVLFYLSLCSVWFPVALYCLFWLHDSWYSESAR